MSEMTSYTPGTPCWVDLGTPDIEKAADFYSGLFGWQAPEAENAEQTGGYRQAMLRGKPVAGMMPLMQEGQPPAWSSYVSVEDADATVAGAKEAGGTVLAEPMDVMDLGRMAVFSDPTGAVLGIWQPGTFVGAEVVKESNAVVWNELNTRDPEAAKSFYAAVFGWSFEEREFETGTYTSVKAGGDTVGGMIDITGRAPEEVPAHWLVYFAVDDVDVTVAKALDSGGGVALEPFDIAEVGRIAIVKDPFEAVFAVMTPDPSMQSS
ncbi:MAG TPA: VOC family protein [Solirubrobacterales bacterium]|nr:VOC family protein [Solirubrobacterales bacterium]